jgi:phosphate transport system protein
MANKRVHFNVAIEGMKEQLACMGAKAEQAIDLAVQSYLARDQMLCSEALSLEKEMNQWERHIDEIAIQLLAHAQQEEIDLRLITVCMKINTNLERIGDLSVNIAELGLSDYRTRIDLPIDILKVSGAKASMIRKALRAFVDANGDRIYEGTR